MNEIAKNRRRSLFVVIAIAVAIGLLIYRRSANSTSHLMPDYSIKLEATKASYPFKQWEESGLDQYTPEACSDFVAVFDRLIAALAAKGEAAPEIEKLECFHEAVLALNALNDQDESLIETGEREDLCELCNLVAAAAGLDPSKYGDGEGPATEWRDW